MGTKIVITVTSLDTMSTQGIAYPQGWFTQDTTYLQDYTASQLRRQKHEQNVIYLLYIDVFYEQNCFKLLTCYFFNLDSERVPDNCSKTLSTDSQQLIVMHSHVCLSHSIKREESNVERFRFGNKAPAKHVEIISIYV
jgi:hypothetical protein